MAIRMYEHPPAAACDTPFEHILAQRLVDLGFHWSAELSVDEAKYIIEQLERDKDRQLKRAEIEAIREPKKVRLMWP